MNANVLSELLVLLETMCSSLARHTTLLPPLVKENHLMARSASWEHNKQTDSISRPAVLNVWTNWMYSRPKPNLRKCTNGAKKKKNTWVAMVTGENGSLWLSSCFTHQHTHMFEWKSMNVVSTETFPTHWRRDARMEAMVGLTSLTLLKQTTCANCRD